MVAHVSLLNQISQIVTNPFQQSVTGQTVNPEKQLFEIIVSLFFLTTDRRSRPTADHDHGMCITPMVAQTMVTIAIILIESDLFTDTYQQRSL